MAASPVGRRGSGSEGAGAVLGLVPVAGLLGVLLWLLLVTPRPASEAGFPPSAPVPTTTPSGGVFGLPALAPRPLVIVTTSQARAGEIRSLLDAEAALHETLAEHSRVADVVVAASDEAAAAIIAAINADAGLSSNDAPVQAVVVP
jgi:hypothetical protein